MADDRWFNGAALADIGQPSSDPPSAASSTGAPPPQTGRMSAGTRRTVKSAGSALGTPSKGATGGMTAGKKRMAAVTEKAVGLKDRLRQAREDVLELRQDACDLQEYASAKLMRAQSYLQVLAKKAQGLDQIAQEAESKVAPLKKERRRLFNSLIQSKGNIRVVCRVRPPFEHEDSLALSFPDETTIRINPSAAAAAAGAGGVGSPGSMGGAASMGGGGSSGLAKRDYELDHIYGPHVGQGDLFLDAVQPMVQAVMDGFNASIIAYGQSGSGKSHTMEGPSHDRGIFYRAFDEIYDLANSAYAPAASYTFHISVLEMFNEQLSDLLVNPMLAGHGSVGKVEIVEAGVGGGGGGGGGGVGGGGAVELRNVTEEAVSNPMEYAKVVKTALQHRAAGGGASGGGGLIGDSKERNKLSHLVVIVRVHHEDPVTGEQQSGKLLLADLASSERLLASSSASGDKLTASLHVQKSFSALGDCLSALTGKRPTVPYRNSKLTTLLSDSLGGDAKTVLVVTCSPSVKDVSESALSLAFAARSRNSELSLGTRDTIKKWRDMANDARREVFESERQTAEAQQEVLRLRDALRASEQTGCVLLTELQRAWAQAGLVEAQHHAEVERLMAELAAGVEAQRRMEEEWETRAVVEGAKTVREHEEEMERLQEQHIAEIEAYKIQVEQLHGRLAEAAEMAATVAALRRPQEDSAEVAELRQQYEMAVQKMTAYKSELEKSEALNRELNAENGSLLSRLEATNSALAALENSALMKVEVHAQAHAHTQAQAQQAQGPAAAVNGVAGHGEGGAAAGEGQGGQQQQQQQQQGGQQQGQGNEAKGGPAAAAAAGAGGGAAAGKGAGRQQQGGSAEWERRRDEVVGKMNRVMVDGQSAGDALAEESNGCLRELVTAVASLPAGSEEEGRAVEEVRGAVMALLAWAHSKALSLDWPLVSAARLLLLRVLRSKSADVQASKIPAIERFLEKALPQPVKPALQKSSTFSLPTTATPAPGSALRTLRLDLKLPGGDKGGGPGGGAGGGGGGSASIADRRSSASFRLPSFRASGRKSVGVGGAPTAKVSEARIKEIRQEAADHAKGHKELALVFAHFSTAKPTSTATAPPLSHPFTSPSSLPADLITRLADVTSLEQRVLQWIGSQFGFWAASEPPRDAQEDVVAVAAAVVDGWREGLGTFMRYSEDALGQVLADWSFRHYRTQLGNLKDVGSSLLVEEADDMEHVIKLRLGLEAVRHKRAKLLRDVAADASLGAHREEILEGHKRWEADGGAKEEARIASLGALEKIFRACQDSMEALSASRLPSDEAIHGMRETLAREQREGLPVLAGPDKMVGEQIIAYALQFFPPVSETSSAVNAAASLPGTPGSTQDHHHSDDQHHHQQQAPHTHPSHTSAHHHHHEHHAHHHEHHEHHRHQHQEHHEAVGSSGLSKRLFHDSDHQPGGMGPSHAGAASSPARHSAASAGAAAHRASSPSRHSATASPSRRPASPQAQQEGAAAAGRAGGAGVGSSLWSQVTGLVDGLGRGTPDGAGERGGGGGGEAGGGGAAAAEESSLQADGTKSIGGERSSFQDSAAAGGEAAAAGGTGGGSAAAAPSVASRQEEVRRRAEQEGVREWTAVQLNSAEGPLVIKCGATHRLQLAIKFFTGAADAADAAAAAAGAGGAAAAFAATTSSGSLEPDTLSVLPDPSALSGLSLEKIRTVLSPLLPAPIVHVIVAKSANATRARYGRIHSTLAARVPVLRGAPSSAGPATSRAAESSTTIARPTGSYSAASTPGRGVSSGGRRDVVELEGRSWSRGASLANSMAATPISSSPLHGPLRGGGTVGGSVRMSLEARGGDMGGGGEGEGVGGRMKKSSSMHELPDAL
ncbi:hypothetical protein CLOP_g6332 [Closterium sp. NIES-67]|nr:hypothetical protein CLOP_g6332 [Closterium sp. NIES-67]